MADIVFDGAPGPLAPRFVEIENPPGISIRLGGWFQRDDGRWVIRFTPRDAAPDLYEALAQLLEHVGATRKDWPDFTDLDLREQAQAALAKARGETP